VYDLKMLKPEEIIALAKTPIPEDKLKDLPQIRRFIISYGIIEGQMPIPSSLVYYRYCDWCKEHSQESVSIIKFGKEFGLYFKRKRTAGSGFSYLLNSEGFDLSLENKQHVKDNWKRTSATNGKKTKARKAP
jgi:ribosomal protein L44E